MESNVNGVYTQEVMASVRHCKYHLIMCQIKTTINIIVYTLLYSTTMKLHHWPKKYNRRIDKVMHCNKSKAKIFSN